MLGNSRPLLCVVLMLTAFAHLANASQQAYSPYPANSVEDVPHNVCLSWSPGEEPCPPPLTHYVFLSTDYNQVADGNLAAIVDDTEANELCVEDLCLGATYYWRVDSVCLCYTADGNIWSFTVTGCAIFDDMESYDNDDYNNYIWDTWIDGAGCATEQGNCTGSILRTATDPVHTGSKSMEYLYSSTGWDREYAYSKANRPLDPPENFSDTCKRVLVLWFYGNPDNITESMWVVLSDDSNDGQVTYGTIGPDSPDDIRNAEWKDFVIDLQDFADAGVDLENITEVSIGFGPRGREGKFPGDPIGIVYFDDISLCTNICVPRYVLADFNGDCFVGFQDYAILGNQWLQSPGNPSADIAPESPDGVVNWLDLAVLADSWLKKELWPPQ